MAEIRDVEQNELGMERGSKRHGVRHHACGPIGKVHGQQMSFSAERSSLPSTARYLMHAANYGPPGNLVISTVDFGYAAESWERPGDFAQWQGRLRGFAQSANQRGLRRATYRCGTEYLDRRFSD